MGTKVITPVTVTDAATLLVRGKPEISSIFIVNTGAVLVEIGSEGMAFGDGIPLQPGQYMQIDGASDSCFAITEADEGSVRVGVISGGGVFQMQGLLVPAPTE
jgi:hypothetical protein